MKNSIYSPTGMQRYSSVSLEHTKNWGTAVVVDTNNITIDDATFINAVVSVSSGTTTLVNATADCFIEVKDYALSSAANNTFKFRSGSNDLTGVINISANGTIVANGTSALFKCNKNETFNIVTTGAITGHISYRVI